MEKGTKQFIKIQNSKTFDLFIQILIIISILSFSYETLPNLSSAELEILYYLEIIIVVIFSLEYILRIYTSENKLKFIFSFYGIIDLLAILPFYISATMDLRSIRLFRLFRLLRTFKFMRYSQALVRLLDAFRVVKNEMIIFLFLTIFLLYFTSVGIYYFESEVQPEHFQSVFHCLWWSVVTLTTVGYGDIYPITVGGKIFTSFILVIGLGIVAVPTGLFASALTKTIKDDSKKGNK